MADPFAGWSAPEPAARSETAAPETDPYAGWSAPVAPEEGPGTGEALLRGGAQGATLGYEDELAGVLETLVDKMAGKDQGKSFADLYRQHRDESRKANAAAQSAHPIAYGGADVAGSLASGLALPVGEGLAGALKLGAGLGAASGLGTSQADLTTGDVAGAAKDVATGAGTGLAGGALGYGLSKIGEPLEKLGIMTGRRAIQGGTSPLSTKMALSDDAVKAAIEHGALRPLSTTGDISERLDAVRQQLGEQYGSLIDQLQAAGVKGPNADELAGKLFEQAKTASKESLLSPKPALFRKVAREVQGKPDELLGPIGQKYRSYMADLADQGLTGDQAEQAVRDQLAHEGLDPSQLDLSSDLPLGAADRMKRALQHEARPEYDKLTNTITPTGEAKLAVADTMRDAIEKSVQDQADKAPELAEQFEPVKEDLGNVIAASNAARKGANQQAKRNFFGLRDVAFTGAGLLSHGPLGLTYGAGSKLLNLYGPSTASFALYKAGGAIQRIVQSNPQALGHYGALLSAALYNGGQDAFDANLYTLQQTDPQFQQRVKAINEQTQGQ